MALTSTKHIPRYFPAGSSSPTHLSRSNADTCIWFQDQLYFTVTSATKTLSSSLCITESIRLSARFRCSSYIYYTWVYENHELVSRCHTDTCSYIKRASCHVQYFGYDRMLPQVECQTRMPFAKRRPDNYEQRDLRHECRPRQVSVLAIKANTHTISTIPGMWLWYTWYLVIYTSTRYRYEYQVPRHQGTYGRILTQSPLLYVYPHLLSSSSNEN